MKSFDEIIIAHDLIDGILQNDDGIRDVMIDLTDEIAIHMQYQRDVLCWILGHDSGETFQHNLDELVRRSKELGYRIGKIQ